MRNSDIAWRGAWYVARVQRRRDAFRSHIDLASCSSVRVSVSFFSWLSPSQAALCYGFVVAARSTRWAYKDDSSNGAVLVLPTEFFWPLLRGQGRRTGRSLTGSASPCRLASFDQRSMRLQAEGRSRLPAWSFQEWSGGTHVDPSLFISARGNPRCARGPCSRLFSLASQPTTSLPCGDTGVYVLRNRTFSSGTLSFRLVVDVPFYLPAVKLALAELFEHSRVVDPARFFLTLQEGGSMHISWTLPG